MFSVSFPARLFAQDFLGLLGGVVVYTALSVVLEVLRVMEDIDVVLNATSVSLVGKLSMIKLGLSSTILG